MKDFIKDILQKHYGNDYEKIFDKSPLFQYLDFKMSAIYGNVKSRRSLANIYAIYSILHFYVQDFFDKKEKYKDFEGYEYTKLFRFYRSLYGGEKLQNHALNSRVNGEFKNKIVRENENALIIINNGKYLLHIQYLYVNETDISKLALQIIETYIKLLQNKDTSLIATLETLLNNSNYDEKLQILKSLLQDDCEARIFEIISYAILKNHYKSVKIYIGFSLDSLEEKYLELYKTGRTNANDGGIDFVLRPLGRFFQVSEVNHYDKYLLDIDKVLHFPITFVIKTTQTKDKITQDFKQYIKTKSCGMKIIEERYNHAVEEIITINELVKWLENLKPKSINSLIKDIELYYKLELNLLN